MHYHSMLTPTRVAVAGVVAPRGLVAAREVVVPERGVVAGAILVSMAVFAKKNVDLVVVGE